MPAFGPKSLSYLSTVDARLQQIGRKAIQYIDIICLEGHRGKEKQDEYFEEGLSELRWPNGNHNADPSKAVHFAVYHKEKPHIHWGSQREFSMLAGRIMQIADEMGYRIRWGGDWDMDDDLTDQKFNDLVHYEILEGTP